MMMYKYHSHYQYDYQEHYDKDLSYLLIWLIVVLMVCKLLSMGVINEHMSSDEWMNEESWIDCLGKIMATRANFFRLTELAYA